MIFFPLLLGNRPHDAKDARTRISYPSTIRRTCFHICQQFCYANCNQGGYKNKKNGGGIYNIYDTNLDLFGIFTIQI